jgi:hypothetical protein
MINNLKNAVIFVVLRSCVVEIHFKHLISGAGAGVYGTDMYQGRAVAEPLYLCTSTIR